MGKLQKGAEGKCNYCSTDVFRVLIKEHISCPCITSELLYSLYYDFCDFTALLAYISPAVNFTHREGTALFSFIYFMGSHSHSFQITTGLQAVAKSATEGISVEAATVTRVSLKWL